MYIIIKKVCCIIFPTCIISTVEIIKARVIIHPRH